MARGWFAALFLACGLTGGLQAAAAGYPERPVTMIVAFNAGGGTDVLARMIAPFIAKYLGAAVEVVNRPGEGGEIGFAALAAAAPDGYTIGFINVPNVVTLLIEHAARYSLEGLTPVALLVDDPTSLTVNPGSPINTLQDLVTEAGPSPTPLTVGTTGVGSAGHLGTLMFAEAARIRLTPVPFPGSSAAREALLGGEIAVGGMSLGEAAADIRAGRLKALGVMARQRSALAPDIPTLREQGYDIMMNSVRGIAAPAGLDPAVLQVLERAVDQAAAVPEFVVKARDADLPLNHRDSRAFTQYLLEEDAAYRMLWQYSPWR